MQTVEVDQQLARAAAAVESFVAGRRLGWSTIHAVLGGFVPTAEIGTYGVGSEARVNGLDLLKAELTSARAILRALSRDDACASWDYLSALRASLNNYGTSQHAQKVIRLALALSAARVALADSATTLSCWLQIYRSYGNEQELARIPKRFIARDKVELPPLGLDECDASDWLRFDLVAG